VRALLKKIALYTSVFLPLYINEIDLFSTKLQSVRENERNLKKERKEVQIAPFIELSSTSTVIKMVRFLWVGSIILGFKNVRLM